MNGADHMFGAGQGRSRTIVAAMVWRIGAAAVIAMAGLTAVVASGGVAAAGGTPTITGVTFSGTPGDDPGTIVTVTGSGFGSDVSALGPVTGPTQPGETGADYGYNFIFADETPTPSWSSGWVGGAGGAWQGVDITSYSDTQIVFDFPYESSVTYAGAPWVVNSGDTYYLSILGAQFGGTAYGTSPAVLASATQRLRQHAGLRHDGCRTGSRYHQRVPLLLGHVRRDSDRRYARPGELHHRPVDLLGAVDEW